MEPQETKFNTSFIPKKSVAATYNSTGIRKKGPSLLSIIGMFLFTLAIIGAGGSYWWRIKIGDDIEKQINDLKDAKDQFDEDFIAEATRLNKKINSVKKLLEDHVAPSIIFKILEGETMKNVSYNSFKYETDTDGLITINGTGIAKSLESVVLQSDELGKSDFRDVLFDNIQNIENDNVSFSLEATLDNKVILFSKKTDQIFTGDDDNQFNIN